MDVEREWRKEAPREPMTSLAALVRDFQWRFPRTRRDMVVEYCRKAPTLDDAIYRAVMSKNEQGKHHNHQSKINRDAYYPMWLKLRSMAGQIALVVGFDHLHDLVANADIPGWGPVGWYDISTRIGAFLKLEPESVYLHAGVKQGWSALMGGDWSRVKRVNKEWWPESLKVLTPDECEDFLCTYRAVFNKLEEKA